MPKLLIEKLLIEKLLIEKLLIERPSGLMNWLPSKFDKPNRLDENPVEIINYPCLDFIWRQAT